MPLQRCGSNIDPPKANSRATSTHRPIIFLGNKRQFRREPIWQRELYEAALASARLEGLALFFAEFAVHAANPLFLAGHSRV